ncbi:hypothetical protein DICPUDRAFT_99083, partial [Dictyostelium purpureum]
MEVYKIKEEKKDDTTNSNKITQEEKFLLDNLVRNETPPNIPMSPALKLNNSSISLKDSNFDLSSNKNFESTCIITSPVVVSPTIVNKISLLSSNKEKDKNKDKDKDSDIEQELYNINKKIQQSQPPSQQQQQQQNNLFKPITPIKSLEQPQQQNSFTYEKTPTGNKQQQQQQQSNYNVKNERISPIPFPNISMLINDPTVSNTSSSSTSNISNISTTATATTTTNRLKTPLSTPVKSQESAPSIELEENIPSSSTTSSATTATPPETKKKSKQWSFKDYLYDEINGGYLSTEVIDSKKREQVYNFVHVPLELEKLILFGFLVCFDSFLFLFTFLPIRFFFSFFKLLQSFFSKKIKLTTNQIFDLIRGFIWVSCFIFLTFIDSSMLYHYIRGQAVIKLYVIYNVLEVLDKLCCSFGQDIFDSLYWMSYSFSHSKDIKEKSQKETRILAPVSHTIVATGYVFLHSLVLFSQVITLNVAINSYNNALLTLMISNQFVELKGSVFKRFEKENLFQISCSDIVERFQAFIFLMIIAFQNLSDLNWDLSKDYFLDIGLVFLTVLGSELVVDAIKHAFITKFNKLPPKLYTKFFIILSDNIVDPRNRNFTESSWGINNIIGFVPFPLASIIIRFFYKFIPFDNVVTGIVLTVQIYICLVLLKIFIKIVIIGQCLSNNDSCLSTPDPSNPTSSSSSTSEKLN